MHFQDDRYYINQVLAGNINAFSYLIEKYKKMAYTLALKLVQVPEDAEEIAQDGFLKAYQALSDFKGESKFSTWLYKIIFNLSISRLRKKKLEFVSLDDDQNSHFDVSETEHFFSKFTEEEQKEILRSAISRLSEEEQALIVLYYMDENSVKDIAYVTGDTESNVKIKLFRCRKKLWEIMRFNFKEYEKYQ